MRREILQLNAGLKLLLSLRSADDMLHDQEIVVRFLAGGKRFFLLQCFMTSTGFLSASMSVGTEGLSTVIKGPGHETVHSP